MRRQDIINRRGIVALGLAISVWFAVPDRVAAQCDLLATDPCTTLTTIVPTMPPPTATAEPTAAPSVAALVTTVAPVLPTVSATAALPEPTVAPVLPTVSATVPPLRARWSS